MKDLEDRIRTYTPLQLQTAFKNSLIEWAETDTYVKKKAGEVLSEQELTDDYSFVSVEDIVDRLVLKIKELQNR